MVYVCFGVLSMVCMDGLRCVFDSSVSVLGLVFFCWLYMCSVIVSNVWFNEVMIVSVLGVWVLVLLCISVMSVCSVGYDVLLFNDMCSGLGSVCISNVVELCL